MSRRRTDMHRLQELVRLHRMGRGVRDVARLLRMSPNTERKYREALAAEGLLEGAATALPSSEVLKAAVLKHHPPRTPEHERSSLAAWEPRVQALMAAGLKARAIYDRLTLEETDFDSSYWAVKRLVRRLAKDRGPRPDDVAIPVDTPPGEVAQVDFGYVGRLRSCHPDLATRLGLRDRATTSSDRSFYARSVGFTRAPRDHYVGPVLLRFGQEV